MVAGGKTNRVKVSDVVVGRRIVCDEKPNTPATSVCAKKLKATVAAAKKGMTAQQLKLWRKMVYAPAVLQVKLFCEELPKSGNSAARGGYKLPPNAREGTATPTSRHKYKSCVEKVLAGKIKFKGLFGKKFKWADFLINGAKMVKKLPTSIIKIVILGTNPNGPLCKNPEVWNGKRCVCKPGYVPHGSTCKKKSPAPRPRRPMTIDPYVDGAE